MLPKASSCQDEMLKRPILPGYDTPVGKWSLFHLGQFDPSVRNEAGCPALCWSLGGEDPTKTLERGAAPTKVVAYWVISAVRFRSWVPSRRIFSWRFFSVMLELCGRSI